MDQQSQPSQRALPLEPGNKVVRQCDPLVCAAEHELAGMQHEWLVVGDLDQLREVGLLLTHVDVGIPVVGEHTEARVDAQVYARWLYGAVGERVDHDPSAFQFLADRPV